MRRGVLALVAWLATAAPLAAAPAQVTINQLPAAATIGGTEQVPLFQGGFTRQAPLSGMLGYFQKGLLPLTGGALTGPLALPSGNPAENDNNAATTAVSQTRLSHVANMAAVAGWTNTAYPLEVDGTNVAGDGGRRRMIYDGANACGAGGHPPQDGYTCVNSSVAGLSGSWNISWASVGHVASVGLFESYAGSGTNTAAAETAAIQGALNTGRDVFLPTGTAGTYSVVAGATPGAALSYAKNGQRLFGLSSTQVTLLCYLPSSPGAINPCLNTAGLGGVRFDGFQMYYPGVPDTTSTSDKTPYGPLVYAENSPDLRSTDVVFGRANVDVDMRGNSGGSTFVDAKFSCFASCWQIDGSLDSNHWVNPHGFVYDLTTNQTTVFYTSAVGWDVGRMDDFRIDGGLYIGATAFSFHPNVQTTSPGSVFGSIVNFDCDGSAVGCIKMTSGRMSAANLASTIGQPTGYAANVSGAAELDLATPYIFVSANLTQPALWANNGGTIVVSGGDTTYADNGNVRFDATVAQSGASGAATGQLIMTGHNISKLSGSSASPMTGTHPVLVAYGRAVLVGNVLSDLGTVASGFSNNFIVVPADNFDTVIGNVGPGWSNSFPSSVTSAVITGNNRPTASAAPN